jgi:TatD DNase family protein
VKRIVELDLYIGINGCSFKTVENLETLKHIPLDRIMLETDSPYCEIRNSHSGASMVKTKFPTKNKRTAGFLLKGRNEPCKIVEVLEVASTVLGIS